MSVFLFVALLASRRLRFRGVRWLVPAGTLVSIAAMLLAPSGGRVFFTDGHGRLADIAPKKGKALRAFRRRIQMIFQDPFESMNPRRTILDTVAEPLAVQKVATPAERKQRVAEILGLVGLSPPSAFLFRYPHELSGGQRQSVAIARALVIEPSFVVADEPTSMLDASIRTGIMRLMTDLAERLEVSYLCITHDLAVARYMCGRIAVMYLGKIVEMGETEELLQKPLHPYTKALLSAVPVPDPAVKRPPAEIEGGVTRPVDPPPICRFYDRCPIREDVCQTSPHPRSRIRAAATWLRVTVCSGCGRGGSRVGITPGLRPRTPGCRWLSRARFH